MEPTIRRVSGPDVPPVHQILLACGFDLKDRFGVSHWLPPIYPLERMLEDAIELEVYALTSGEHLVGTFTLEIKSTVPLGYLKYGNIHWQVTGMEGNRTVVFNPTPEERERVHSLREKVNRELQQEQQRQREAERQRSRGLSL